jgi:hypothetical protein
VNSKDRQARFQVRHLGAKDAILQCLTAPKDHRSSRLTLIHGHPLHLSQLCLRSLAALPVSDSSTIRVASSRNESESSSHLGSHRRLSFPESQGMSRTRSKRGGLLPDLELDCHLRRARGSVEYRTATSFADWNVQCRGRLWLTPPCRKLCCGDGHLGIDSNAAERAFCWFSLIWKGAFR